jgi:hypothetical protein
VTLADYQDTYSWQAAVALSRPLTKLIEELPVPENYDLKKALQSLMIELPAAIGNDLISGAKTRDEVYVRLQTTLELVEAIYPALDIAASKTALQGLVVRGESDSFDEVKAPPTPVVDDDEDEDEPEPESESV